VNEKSNLNYVPPSAIVFPNLRSRVAFSAAWYWGWLRFIWYVNVLRSPLKQYSAVDQGTAGVTYSKKYFVKYGPDERIYWTTFLLSSIPDLKRTSLLIIGPRYETELLIARSLGFEKNKVRGLDTFSYSPLIDVGDMHKLPYEDGAFDNMICGWTLSYSLQPLMAASEMTRVLASGGYLVLSVQKVKEDFSDYVDGVLTKSSRVQTLAQFDELFPNLERVAGFEPRKIGESSHTLVAYFKP